jgi:hypothetical protein
MAKHTVIISLLTLFLMPLQDATEEYKNYQLTIDGKTYDFNLGQTLTITKQDGTQSKITVKRKKYTQIKTLKATFQVPGNLSAATSGPEDGVTQTVVLTANGTMVMVQAYSDMDPTGLVSLMLKELTKESVEYGYKMTKKEITRKLADGTEMKGLKATLTYRDETLYTTVLAKGTKDEGTIVVTQIYKADLKAEQPILDHFWKTLKTGK